MDEFIHTLYPRIKDGIPSREKAPDPVLAAEIEAEWKKRGLKKMPHRRTISQIGRAHV